MARCVGLVPWPVRSALQQPQEMGANPEDAPLAEHFTEKLKEAKSLEEKKAALKATALNPVSHVRACSISACRSAPLAVVRSVPSGSVSIGCPAAARAARSPAVASPLAGPCSVRKMQELVRREERRPKLSTIARTVQAVENLRRDRLSLIAANQQVSSSDAPKPTRCVSPGCVDVACRCIRMLYADRPVRVTTSRR